MTKKEIVKQISERIGLTQLKTKEIVQQTFDAIVETLIEVGRIELRNFGVFEVKRRKAQGAQPAHRRQGRCAAQKRRHVQARQGDGGARPADDQRAPSMDDEDEAVAAEVGNGLGDHEEVKKRAPARRARTS